MQDLALIAEALMALGIAILGAVYVVRGRFMPYHAAATGLAWSEVPEPLRALIVALMRVVGGTWIAVSATVLWLLFVAAQTGAVWAIVGAGLGGALTCLSAFLVTVWLGRVGRAQPPRLAALAGVVIFCLGTAVLLGH